MKRVRIPGTDLDVSELCYGLGRFGSAVKGEPARRLYETVRQADVNFFDTAHCYSFWMEGGSGASERALGECVRGRGEREQVVIATKGGHPGQGARYPRPEICLAPAVILSDLGESLERLGMESVDLYLLHRDDRRVPVGEIIDTLSGEVDRGRIRYLGASNWTVERIAEANAYARAKGRHGFVISEPEWSLAQSNTPSGRNDADTRFFGEEAARWHAETGMAVMAFTPTARGYFATGGAAGREAFDNPVSRGRLERASQLAGELGCTPNQVALAYLRYQPFTVIPILGSINPEHLADGLGTVNVRLTAEQVKWLVGTE